MSTTLTKDKLVSALTTYLRNLAGKRTNRTVSADDVHTFLTKRGVSERQVRTRLAYVNTVLRRPTFKRAGEVTSSRPAAKYRRVTSWKLSK